MSCNGTVTVGEETIGGDLVGAWPSGSLYFVLINGLLAGKVKMNSVTITDDADGTSSCTCSSLNPPVVPLSGQTLSVVYQDEVIFAGLIRLVTLTSGPDEAVKEYAIEAGGWELLLQRRSVTKSYSNIAVGKCISDALTTGSVREDGIVEGIVDDGPMLVLVNADHVRVWDFIRDIGKAGGGVCFVNPYKQVMYSLMATPWAGIQLGNADALDISVAVNFDNYRNQMVVKCTSLDGSTSQTATRTNSIEVAARIAAEGGSGVYEVYLAIQHPTSNISGDLSLYAQSVAYISLLIYGKAQTTVTLRTRNPILLRVGQFVRCNFSGMGIVGTYVVIRRQILEVYPELQFTVDLVDSTVQQVAIQSLLRIVGAAQAAIAILANIFPNSQTFTTPGAATWTVPGGIISVTITCLGAGGGGGGASPYWDQPGGHGGNGGKAVSIVAVTPGQVINLVIGTGGAPGVSGGSAAFYVGWSAGSNGTDTTADGGGPTGSGGAGGSQAMSDYPSTPNQHDGAAGGGSGDAVTVGAGSAGGLQGFDLAPYPDVTSCSQPLAGNNGLVEIRW